MAGFGDFLGGFVKGAAGYGAQVIDDRRKMEMETQKAKLLAQLQLETEKEMELFKDKLSSQKADKNFSTADFTSGDFIMRNEKGDEIGRRKLTDDEKKAHQMDLDKDQVDIDSKKADINYKTRSLDLQSQQLGIEGMNAQTSRMRANTDAEELKLKKNDSGYTTLDGKPIAKAEYNSTISELTKAGANPRVLATFQTNWQNGLDSGWSLAQQKVYLREMRKSFTKDKGLLDSFPNVDPDLEEAMQRNKGG